MTQINLLPWREEERKFQKIIFGITLGAFVCLTLVAVIFFHIYLKVLVHDQQVRTSYLQTELQNTQTEITTLKDRQKQQAAIRSELQLIIELRTQSFQTVRLLNALVDAVPKTIVLEKLARNGKSITIEGKAESDLQATVMMKNLAAVPGFQQPVLTEIDIDPNSLGSGKHFQMKVELDN